MKNRKYDDNFLVDYSGQQNKYKLRKTNQNTEGQSAQSHLKTDKQYKDIHHDQDNMILSTIQVKKTMSGKRSAKQ